MNKLIRCSFVTAVLMAVMSFTALAVTNGKAAPQVTSFTNDGKDVTVTWEAPSWNGVDKYEIEIDRISDGTIISTQKYKSLSINAGEDLYIDTTISKKGYYRAKVRAKDVNNLYTDWSSLSDMMVTITSDDLGGSSSPTPTGNGGNGSGPAGTLAGGTTGSTSGSPAGDVNSGSSSNGGTFTATGMNPASTTAGGVYSRSSTTDTVKRIMVNTYMAAGWQQDANGRWYLYNDGTYPVNSWRAIDGAYYHFNKAGYVECNRWVYEANGAWYFCTADGRLALGWNNVNGRWFYMNPSNGITTMGGNQLIDGKYYFLNNDGSRAQNQWANGYYYGNDGVRVN